jgi:hypothetical protein
LGIAFARDDFFYKHDYEKDEGRGLLMVSEQSNLLSKLLFVPPRRERDERLTMGPRLPYFLGYKNRTVLLVPGGANDTITEYIFKNSLGE